MTKLTTSAAIIFMLTSLALAYFSGHMPASSIMSGKQSQKPAPVSPVKPMPAAPTAPVSPVK